MDEAGEMSGLAFAPEQIAKDLVAGGRHLLTAFVERIADREQRLARLGPLLLPQVDEVQRRERRGVANAMFLDQVLAVFLDEQLERQQRQATAGDDDEVLVLDAFPARAQDRVVHRPTQRLD